MSGSLVVLGLARPSPLNGGTIVAGAKLFCYDAGGTTKRNTYTTSALSVANANPLVADANGRFGPAWINPDSGSYKLVLTSSGDTDPPASPFWTEDNIPVNGVTYSEGSFTGTLTGYATPPTGTINYRIFANAAGTGKICTLYAAAAITGTSNATAMTMTGLPAACTPSVAARLPTIVTDAGVNNSGMGEIAASGTTLIFLMAAPLSTTGFTGSGTKGLGAGWQFSYAL